MDKYILNESMSIVKLIDVIDKLDLNYHLKAIQDAFESDPYKEEKKDIYEMLIDFVLLLSTIKYQLFPKYPIVLEKISFINSVLKEMEKHSVFLSNN
jgi:hypothetical protein